MKKPIKDIQDQKTNKIYEDLISKGPTLAPLVDPTLAKNKEGKAKKPVSDKYLKKLVDEYDLIQEKKSVLSRRQRDLVLMQVEYYVEIGLLKFDDNE